MGKVVVTRRRPAGTGPPGRGHAGWLCPWGLGVPYSDEATLAQLGERMAERTGGNYAWLFGRWSYEQLLGTWNARGGPFKDALNNTHKYVASSNLRQRSSGRTRRCCTATYRPPWTTSSGART